MKTCETNKHLIERTFETFTLPVGGQASVTFSCQCSTCGTRWTERYFRAVSTEAVPHKDEARARENNLTHYEVIRPSVDRISTLVQQNPEFFDED